MQKVFIRERLKHLVEWARVLTLIFNNRGRNTYGALAIKRVVQKYILDNSASASELRNAESSLQIIEGLLRPMRVENLQRFGAENDGGYIGIETRSAPTLLSGGGGKNIDFEFELAEKGSKVHLYDPTISKLPKEHFNVSHYKKALDGPGNKNFKHSATLSEAFIELNPNLDQAVWLKLDIEGSEIELLFNDLELLPKFEQIFIEFHETFQVISPKFQNQFITVLSALKKDFHLVSMVSNNWKGVTNYGCSFLPDTFEATFLSREFPIKSTNESGYESLKRVNNRNRPSIPDLPFRITN